jgi:TonB family protein
MRLLHKGRCQIHTVRLLYVVTEYADEDLSQIIPERPLTASEAREMLHPVLDALACLHERGLVHGHLRPSNVMVVDNQVKISGDGIHVLGDDGGHFSAPTVYDAPEVAQTISPAADVWSLGVTLVEALTQHVPVWDRSTDAQPAVLESVPKPFGDIAQECLRVDPTRRCTLTEIKARLENAPSVSKADDTTSRTMLAKHSALAVGVLALAVLAVVAIVKLRPGTASSLTTEELHPAPLTSPLTSRSPEASEAQSSKGVLVKGAVAERVLPRVPRSARQTIQGKIKVTVRVQVDPSGGVSNARLDSPGPSKYFANLALQAARRWKFRPAQLNGQAVSSVWVLRFRFGRHTTDVSPVEATPA